MRPRDTHAAGRKASRNGGWNRLLTVSLLAGTAVALGGGAWWGMQLKAELAARDAIIDRLVSENLDLERVRDRAHDLEMALKSIDVPSAPKILPAELPADLSEASAVVAHELAETDQRRVQAMTVMERLSAEQQAEPVVVQPVKLSSPEVAMLNAALDRALADRAMAENAAKALSAKSAVLSARSASLEASLDGLSKELDATKQHFQSWVQQHYGALRGVLKTSGVRVDPLVKLAEAKMDGEGGPFVPPPSGADRADRTTLVPIPPSLDTDVRAVDVISQLLVALPLGVPVPEAETRSGFGIRRDPFTRHSAMHTGLDFAPGPLGKAFATAPGTVVHASRQGAYGKMVEIDHGLGLSTRYAHLAKIEVKVGDRVAQGTEVGVIGTTGRSTGRHLHYEIRVDGVAVDPADFLEARVRLANVLSKE
jgi:murein DD-endopeptidase MepM/ murein hydrolase activator NlpD